MLHSYDDCLDEGRTNLKYNTSNYVSVTWQPFIWLAWHIIIKTDFDLNTSNSIIFSVKNE